MNRCVASVVEIGCLLSVLLGAATPSSAQQTAQQAEPTPNAGLSKPVTDAATNTIGNIVNSLRHGDYASAVRDAEALTRAQPNLGDAWMALGRARAAQGQVEQARQAFLKTPGAAAETRLDGVVAAATLGAIHGDAQLGRVALEAALRAYRSRLKRPTPVVLSSKELIAAGHAARHLARYDSSLYNTSLDAYELALERANVVTSGASERNDSERDTLQVADQVAAHVAIGELLLHRFNNSEALEAFRAALGLDANDPHALLGLARSQHFDHAIATEDGVKQVLAVNPNHLAALSLLATLHIEREDFDQADAVLARGLAVNPVAPALLTQRAALSFLRGDEDRFEEQVAEVRRLAPGFLALYETLSEIAAQGRRYERAAEFALLAVTLNKSSWRGHALLGTNRLRLGDMDAGRRALEIAFRGDPYDPFTKNALDLLDRLSEFREVRSARFVLVGDAKEAAILASRLLPIAERAYDVFAKAYDYQPPTPIRIELYPRHEDLSVRTVGLVGIDLVGVSFGPVVAMDSPSAGVFGPLNFGSVLWHELAHTFHLGLTKSKVPRWFSEGLAVFEERRAGAGWGGDASADFVAAYASGELPKPSELNQIFLRPSTPKVLVHGYYLASLLMELIEREHGFEAIVGLLGAYTRNRNTDQAIREVLEREPASLDAAFAEFMAQRFDPVARALGHSPRFAGDQTKPQSEQKPEQELELEGGAFPALIREAQQAREDERYDDAVAALEKAQALIPQFAGKGSSYVRMAEVHIERGAISAAVEQLTRNVAIDADDLSSHQKLAQLHDEMGDHAAAAAVLERAMLIQPFDPAMHRRLAELLEQLERWPEAIRARAAVVDLDDTDPAAARFALARAHYQAGDDATARRAVLDALEVAPLYQDALELLLQIRGRAGRTQGDRS